MHAKKLKKKNLGEYHDLYVQSDALLLADVFENFRNKFIEIYELYPAYFFISFWISTGSLFFKKKTGIELELFTDIDILLMAEKGIRGGICHGIHKYAKVNNKYIKSYDKIKIYYILCI